MSVVCDFLNENLYFFNQFPGSPSQGSFCGRPFEFNSDAVLTMDDDGDGYHDFVVLRFELTEGPDQTIEGNLSLIFDSQRDELSDKFYIPMPEGRSLQAIVQSHLKALYLHEHYKGEVAKLVEWVDFLKDQSEAPIVFGRAFHRQVQH